MLKLILNTIPNPVFFKDADLIYQGCNKAFLRMLDMEEDELIGKRADELFKPEDADMYKLKDLELLSSKKHQRYIHKAYINDEIRVLVFDKDVLEEDNEQKGIVGVITDITHIEKMKDELYLKDNMFKHLVQSSYDGIMLVNNSGDVIEWNKGQEDLTDLKADEVLGLKAWDIQYRMMPKEYKTPETIKTTKHSLENILINKDFAALNKPQEGIISINDKLKYVQAVSFPFYNKSGDLYLGTVTRDISEQKNNEKKLQQAINKAEESDRMKSVFLANISHEIRTPLNGIIGFAQLLKDETSIDKVHEYTETIETCGDNLLGLINDVIDISKIEANHLCFNPKPVNIVEFNKDIISLFNQTIKQKGKSNLEFKFDCEGISENLVVSMDALRFKQVITNLLNNALKFTDFGFIELSCKYVYKKKNMLSFLYSVKDSGKGIKPEDADRIFDRFYKVNDDSNTGGTGLGLSISKGIIDLMGGKLYFNKNYTEGAHFYVKVDFEEVIDTSLQKQKEAVDKLDLSGKIVLVAEDDDVNYQLLYNILTSVKCKVIRARTGIEAVALFEKHNPELCFLDIKMPKMKGNEALKIIKNINNNVSVVAVTAFAMEEDVRFLLKEGFDEVIAKPILVPSFLKKLHDFFSKI